jgi:hypothetical protein
MSVVCYTSRAFPVMFVGEPAVVLCTHVAYDMKFTHVRGYGSSTIKAYTHLAAALIEAAKTDAEHADEMASIADELRARLAKATI